MPAAKPSMPRLLRSKPLAQGLVGAWPLYEGSGTTVNNVSGQSGNGSFSAAGVAWSKGQAGYCLQFTGASNGNINIPHSASLNITGAFSLSCWVRSPLTGSTFQPFFSKDGTGSGYYLGQKSTADGSLFFGMNAGGNEIDSGATGLGDILWHHICGTFDPTLASNNLKIYYDGKIILQGGTATVPVANTNPLLLGWVSPGSGNAFTGWLDACLVYNRPLSAIEVAALYADSFQMFRPSRTMLKAAAAPTGKLFRPGDLSGLGGGGPFFHDPLGGW